MGGIADGSPFFASYESGCSRIPIKYIVILAKHYDVSADYILGMSDKRF